MSMGIKEIFRMGTMIELKTIGPFYSGKIIANVKEVDKKNNEITLMGIRWPMGEIHLDKPLQ